MNFVPDWTEASIRIAEGKGERGEALSLFYLLLLFLLFPPPSLFAPFKPKIKRKTPPGSQKKDEGKNFSAKLLFGKIQKKEFPGKPRVEEVNMPGCIFCPQPRVSFPGHLTPPQSLLFRESAFFRKLTQLMSHIKFYFLLRLALASFLFYTAGERNCALVYLLYFFV